MGALHDYIATDPVTEKQMVVNFPVCADDPYRIDTEAAKVLLAKYRPEFVIFGKSMVLYKETVAELVKFIREQGIRTTVMYDMAHVLGLVGDHFQKPFEDGSGIGWMNGFDGIWGLEYKNAKKGIVNGAVLEYVDFTNQSGPMHWAPHDHKDTKFTDQVTGGDSYYQNFRCNPYSNFGMSQGTMFIPSTIYDRRGENRIYDNRVRGFQLGVSGNIYAPLEYRLLVNYRKSWGSYGNPRLSVVDNTSFMLEGTYHFKQVKGLTLNGQLAFDKGELAGGDNFGVLLSVKYNGLFDIFKR